MTNINNAVTKIQISFYNYSLFVLIGIDFVSMFCNYVQVKSYLFSSVFNMSDSEMNLLKFEL
jgi:hypothetical protein